MCRAPLASHALGHTRHSTSAAKAWLGWRRTLALVLAGRMSRGEPQNATVTSRLENPCVLVSYRTLACSGLEPECNPANYKLRVANFHIKISHQLSYGTVHVCSRNGRLVATMSFEKGDVSSSPTDDAAPEGEPAPDAAPLPPPPVPAFLEGVSAPTEPLVPSSAAEPSAVEELPAAAPPPPAAAPPLAAPPPPPRRSL